MKTGVLVDSFRTDVRDGILRAKALGVTGIQIYAVEGETAPWNMSQEQRKDLLSFVKEQGMVVTAICGDLGGYGFTNPEENPNKIELSKQIMDLALDLECNVVTTHIGVVPPEVDHPRRAIMKAACEEIGRYGDEVGAKFAIETGPETAVVLKSFLDSLESKGVCVNFDPANLVMGFGEDIVAAVYTLKDYIVHTHAKDGKVLEVIHPERHYSTYGSEMEAVEEWWDYCIETPLGEGQVDFNQYLKALDDIGYTGYLTIEREVGDNPDEDIKLAVDFLEEHLKALDLGE